MKRGAGAAVLGSIGWALLVLAGGAAALDQAAEPQDSGPRENIVSESRQFLGDRYLGIVGAVDNFLSGKALESEHNGSYLKLESGVTAFEHRSAETDFSLKGNIDLPHTRQRWRLFFDSDLREEGDLDRQNQTVSSGKRFEEEKTVAGLEYAQQPKASRWNFSARLGGKVQSSFYPYARVRGQRRWQLVDTWQARLRQDLWYLDSVGWGETSHVEFNRPLGERSLVRIATELEYRDEALPLKYWQLWSISQRVSARLGLDYALAHFGEYRRNSAREAQRFNRHQIGLNLRYQLYQNWIFVSFSPEFAYFRPQAEPGAAEDPVAPWQSEASFTVRFEFFVTENH